MSFQSFVDTTITEQAFYSYCVLCNILAESILCEISPCVLRKMHPPCCPSNFPRSIMPHLPIHDLNEG